MRGIQPSLSLGKALRWEKMVKRQNEAPRQRGRPPKRQPRCAKIAKALGRVGIGGRFMCSDAVLEATKLELDTGSSSHGDQASDELVQMAKQMKPSQYRGQRLNRTARIEPQAKPLLTPPKQPPPWMSPSHALGTRPWSKIGNHVARCIELAMSRPVHMCMINEEELCGELRLRAERTKPTAQPSLTRGRDGTTTAAEQLQRRANEADVRIVHDEADALVVSCTTEAWEAMRAYLSKNGHNAAASAVPAAAALATPKGGEMLDWMRSKSTKESCPNHGSSHTGVTVDFGMQDAPLGPGGGSASKSEVPDALRGGNCHTQLRAQDAQGSLIGESSSHFRANKIAKHRSCVTGKKDKRFHLIVRAQRCNPLPRTRLALLSRSASSFPHASLLAHFRARSNTTVERAARGSQAKTKLQWTKAIGRAYHRRVLAVGAPRAPSRLRTIMPTFG